MVKTGRFIKKRTVRNGTGHNLILKCTWLLVCFLLSAAFFSCAGSADGSGGEDFAESTALAITFPNNTAKRLYERDDIESFSVTISSGYYTDSKTANKGETMLFSNIPAGTYSVKAYGKTAGGNVAATAETYVTIKAGETTSTVITLSRIEHWKVTFLDNAGSEISTYTQEVSDGYTATEPEDPAPLEGKNFSFWTADATATVTSAPFSFNTPITRETTLKPVYGAIEYTVTYVSEPLAFVSDKYTVEAPLTLPTVSSPPDGYVFEGWYPDTSYTPGTRVYSLPAGNTGDKTYYAKWTRIYNITYTMPSGLSVTIASGFDTYTAEASKTLPIASNLTDIPTGLSFAGWYENSDFTGTVKTSISAGSTTGNKTYYAKFTVPVHINPNNGTDSATTYDVIYNKTFNESVPDVIPASMATDLTKTGADSYVWYKTSSAELPTTWPATAFDKTAAITEETYLHAKWLYKDFSGSYDDFIAAEFVKPNTSGTAYNVTLTSATEAQLDSIAIAIGASTSDNYKGVYINLDMSACSITTINNYAFCAQDISAPTGKGTGLATFLVGITLPSGLRTIGTGAFTNCSALVGITLPSGLQSIRTYAFTNCSALTTIDIPSSVILIDYGAFNGTGLTSVTGATTGWTVESSMGGGAHEGVSIGVSNLVTDTNKFTKN